MMKGIVVFKHKENFSRLSDVFKAIGNIENEYNWLITNSEFVSQNDTPFFNESYTWIKGEKLSELISKDDGYWIWGVFSAFEKNIKKEEVLTYPLPFANGYKGFWEVPLTLQNPLAEFEIVEWDGNTLIVISKNDKIIDSLKKYYPFACDLEKYNSED
ncbi:hypothetical protein ATZ33_01880 [Enterococcus silesiacus]|uniref:DUF2691 domain-containing protein n=2 Tax=Enterococcus silesiacus TaxID=332949 RepID=A0ABM5W4N0_9ENTE|nr:DUF2691 family protein [Enterococcus silesiacus]ALS00168.1 hypothetical protein ATZ33_01880 [Enterococcus silesiacus]